MQIFMESGPLVVLFLMAICELIVHMGALDTVFIVVSAYF
jgi:hypothetical protein